MYCILMDAKTKSFYMKPWEMCFYAYTSPDRCKSRPEQARIIETEITDKKDFTTMMYNAGFTYGLLDGEPIHLTRADAYFYSRNDNEIAYAQYLLTGDERYLSSINKKSLLSLCKITEEGAMFPTVQLDDGKTAVLSYTDRARIPQILFDKYPDYRTVRMSFSVRAFVNGKFLAE